MTRRATRATRATVDDMESISHRELRNESGRILKAVAAGESFTITNNGEPVAQLIPVDRPRPGPPVSPAFRAWCDREDVELVGSDLVETEVRRIIHRRDIPQHAATAVLDGIELHEVTRGVLASAALLPGRTLRSLDALHLASALSLRVTALATYDDRLADAARDVGLEVVAPT